MASDDTEQLIEAAMRGDRAARERLLERHLPDLHAFVRLRAGWRIRAKESVADVVQSVCREVLQDLDRFEHRGAAGFRRWLFVSVTRKLGNRQEYYLADKRDARREAAPASGSQAADDATLIARYGSFCTPSGNAMLREQIEQVERAFDMLDDDQREVITLARVAGLTRREIAEEMGRTEGAVPVLLHRALASLSGVEARERAGPRERAGRLERFSG